MLVPQPVHGYILAFLLHIGTKNQRNKRFVAFSYERRKHIEGKSFDDCLLYDLATEPLEETVERLETLLEIGQVLEKLPPLQRWRFILHFFYGYSYPEIAKMQDCNKSAVMRSVHSALKKIRKNVAA